MNSFSTASLNKSTQNILYTGYFKIDGFISVIFAIDCNALVKNYATKSRAIKNWTIPNSDHSLFQVTVGNTSLIYNYSEL